MKDYEKLKRMANRALDRNDVSECMVELSVLSRLMYEFNIIFTDAEAEDLLQRIGKCLSIQYPIPKLTYCAEEAQDKKRVVFYDWFALDDRGLTIIYLKALLKLGYHVLFITYGGRNSNRMRRITDIIKANENAKIYKIRNSDTIKANTELRKVIAGYSPEKALIHTLPEDVVGLAAFSCFKGCFDRFLINITDHAFWLGKTAVDYFLEYRSYGYHISHNYRGIDEKKLIILPYYPADRTEVPFQGFPFEEKGKKIIFSGGSFSKLRGSNLYFKVVKHIIDHYDDTMLLYAGNGDSSTFEEFITSNGYEKRVYCIKERSDLSEVMNRSYFYLSTYPISGGLMAQYAVINGKIPYSFRKEEQLRDEVETVFMNKKGVKLTYTDIKEYINEIDRALRDSDYLKEKESRLKNLIISENDFTQELRECLELYTSSVSPERLTFDIEKAYQNYLAEPDIDNYLRLISKINKESLLLHFPSKFFYIHYLNFKKAYNR